MALSTLAAVAAALSSLVTPIVVTAQRPAASGFALDPADPCNISTPHHRVARVAPAVVHHPRVHHHHRHIVKVKAVAVHHAPLPFRVANHHLVKATPPPNCSSAEGGAMISLIPPAGAGLPALNLGTPDSLLIPSVYPELPYTESETDTYDYGGGYPYGGGDFPFPFGGGVFPAGGGSPPRPGTTTPTIPVTAAPEPSTWALLILGLLMIGVTLRRQKSSRV